MREACLCLLFWLIPGVGRSSTLTSLHRGHPNITSPIANEILLLGLPSAVACQLSMWHESVCSLEQSPADGMQQNECNTCKALVLLDCHMAGSPFSAFWEALCCRYIDYVLSWGPAIAGHAVDEVNDALKAQIDKGTSFGAPCELEVRFKQLV